MTATYTEIFITYLIIIIVITIVIILVKNSIDKNYNEIEDNNVNRNKNLTNNVEKKEEINEVNKNKDDIRYCTLCGKQINIDSVFCNYCGKRQKVQEGKSEKYTFINTDTKVDYDREYFKFYVTDKNVMSKTERIFFRNLKIITDELNLLIFPQVDLERIIYFNDTYVDWIEKNRKRNRIKSRSIDYTIVNGDNYNIICCVELDDYTHDYYIKQKQGDELKNMLFTKVNIPLIRIKPKNNYINELKELRAFLIKNK